jgi:hypothetical protein
MEKRRARRARKGLQGATFEEAAELFGTLVGLEVPTRREELVAIAEYAAEHAPTQAEAERFRTYRNALRAGRTLRWKHLPMNYQEIMSDADTNA